MTELKSLSWRIGKVSDRVKSLEEDRGPNGYSLDAAPIVALLIASPKCVSVAIEIEADCLPVVEKYRTNGRLYTLRLRSVSPPNPSGQIIASYDITSQSC